MDRSVGNTNLGRARSLLRVVRDRASRRSRVGAALGHPESADRLPHLRANLKHPARSHTDRHRRVPVTENPPGRWNAKQLRDSIAVGHDGVHGRVPITSQILGDLGERPAVTADLNSRPPPSTISDRRPWRRDPFVDLTPCADRTVRVRALPSLLRPHQPGRTTEHRQILQHDVVAAVAVNAATATGAHRNWLTAFRFCEPMLHPEPT